MLLAAVTAGSLAPRSLGQQYAYQPDRDYYHNDTASGTFLGGAMGAITGALIGGSKNREGGALIGAGVGALTGNALGRSKDRNDEARAAAGAANVRSLNQQAEATAITNFDLVEMSKAGVSDDLIISTMRNRGTRLNLSPAELISLKQSGVSDRVVLAAQQLNDGQSYRSNSPTMRVTELPPAPSVFVTPAPHYYYHGPRYIHHHRHRRHGHTRARVHYSFGF